MDLAVNSLNQRTKKKEKKTVQFLLLANTSTRRRSIKRQGAECFGLRLLCYFRGDRQVLFSFSHAAELYCPTERLSQQKDPISLFI